MLYLSKILLLLSLKTFRRELAITTFECSFGPTPCSSVLYATSYRSTLQSFSRRFSLTRSRSSGFEFNNYHLFTLFEFAFATLCFWLSLRSLLTRSFMIQKVRSRIILHSSTAFKLTVSRAFHSLCVLFIFPSLYCSLSLSLSCFLSEMPISGYC